MFTKLGLFVRIWLSCVYVHVRVHLCDCSCEGVILSARVRVWYMSARVRVWDRDVCMNSCSEVSLLYGPKLLQLKKFEDFRSSNFQQKTMVIFADYTFRGCPLIHKNLKSLVLWKFQSIRYVQQAHILRISFSKKGIFSPKFLCTQLHWWWRYNELVYSGFSFIAT